MKNSTVDGGVTRRRVPKSSEGEGGYTLVALLAFMSILALAMIAAAPNLQRQAQREREEDAIFRGEQMADAIKAFVDKSPNHQLPTSIDDLLEGVPQGSKKLQVLRISAARDPLSKDGEWKLVRPNSATLIQFQKAIMEFAGRPVDTTKDQFLKQFAQLPQIATITNLGSDSGTTSSLAADDAGDTSTGPFIGVATRSKQDAVITYYGIEKHNEWVFTPLFRD
jgi:type II secretory pathway pseudopilin PulG